MLCCRYGLACSYPQDGSDPERFITSQEEEVGTCDFTSELTNVDLRTSVDLAGGSTLVVPALTYTHMPHIMWHGMPYGTV